MVNTICIYQLPEVEESNISDICNVVGIDRGINFVVATYDSKHKSGFVSGKAIKQKRANYSRLRKNFKCDIRHPQGED